MNLIISVEFLSPTYHGREWPPDPLRLYQALVRGSHEGTRRLRWSQDGLLSEAFRWLEQQACELIVAPSAKRETGRQHWVPNPTTNPDEKTNKNISARIICGMGSRYTMCGRCETRKSTLKSSRRKRRI